MQRLQEYSLCHALCGHKCYILHQNSEVIISFFINATSVVWTAMINMLQEKISHVQNSKSWVFFGRSMLPCKITNNQYRLAPPLPETTDLPSAKIFTECVPSGTRQKSCMPSAAKNTLGKIMALDKQTLCRVLKKKTLGKLWKTLCKTETLGNKPPRGHPSVSVPAVRSLPSVR